MIGTNAMSNLDRLVQQIQRANPITGAPIIPRPGVVMDAPAPIAAGAPSIAPNVQVDAPSLPPTYSSGLPGVFQRMGDKLNEPGMRAALLRSGAATLDGGLGAGISAGAEFMDRRRAQNTAQTQFDQEMSQRQQQIDQTGAFQRGQLDNQAFRSQVDLAELEEARRAKLAGEQLTLRQQNLTANDNAEDRKVRVRGQDIDKGNNIRSNNQSDANSKRTYDASTYGTDAGVFNAGQKNAAGIGSKGASITVKRPAVPDQRVGGTVIPGTPPQSITVNGAPNIPREAIFMLKANPGLASEFERKYGRGTAMLYLGGQ